MKTKILICTVFLALFLTACAGTAEPTATPVDVDAMKTTIAETIVAEMAQTATEVVESFTATPEPTATITLTPTLSITDTPDFAIIGSPTPKICDDMEFLGDVNVPDGEIKAPGEEFVKTWRVRNTAACTWSTGYTIVNAEYGELMGGVATALTAEVLPGAETEISILLKAPVALGTHSSFWRLKNNNGYTFGTVLTVVITVQ